MRFRGIDAPLGLVATVLMHPQRVGTNERQIAHRDSNEAWMIGDRHDPPFSKLPGFLC